MGKKSFNPSDPDQSPPLPKAGAGAQSPPAGSGAQ